MGDRYAAMFARARATGRAALVPYYTLGDPDPGRCSTVLHALVQGGADALELGLPFSDPTADGPELQAAAQRALRAGVTIHGCLAMVRAIRQAYPELPIGLLAYANTVVSRGLDAFYRAANAAGVDSVLVADVPLAEAAPFEEAAATVGVSPVFIAPPNADEGTEREVARRSRGYVYLTSRRGVTGEHDGTHEQIRRRIGALSAHGAPPVLVGFGIATPADVAAVCAAGADGVIVGSALVRRVVAGEDVQSYLRALREAMARAGSPPRGPERPDQRPCTLGSIANASVS